jgi:hypothetical protein
MLFTSTDGSPVTWPTYISPSHVCRVQGIRPRRTRLTSKLVPPASATTAVSAPASIRA